MGKGKAGKGQEEDLQFPQDDALPWRLHELGGSGSKTCRNLSFSYFFFYKIGIIKKNSSILSIGYIPHHPRDRRSLRALECINNVFISERCL